MNNISSKEEINSVVDNTKILNGISWPGVGSNFSYGFFDSLPNEYSKIDTNIDSQFFSQFSAAAVTATKNVFNVLTTFTNLSFNQVSTDAALLNFGQYDGNDLSNLSLNSGHIWINNINKQVENSYTEADAFHILMQKIGYALGLNYITDTSVHSVMSKQYWGETVGFMADDIQALQKLYGANLTYQNQDDRYILTPNKIKTIWDTSGQDLIDGSLHEKNLSINLGEGEFSAIDGVNTIAIAYNTIIENAYGGAGNDYIVGNNFSNFLKGGKGDDTLLGLDGKDLILGDEGNDKIDGGKDNDRLYGKSGADSIEGGSGNDIIFGGDDVDKISGGSGSDTIEGNNGNDFIDGGQGNDYLWGNKGEDYIEGDTGNDFIRGGQGNDTVYGGDGDDGIYGDAGNDFMDGEEGNDFIRGGLGDDVLYGNGGNDVIYGDKGDDFIYGDFDSDLLYGGNGNDFIYGGRGNDCLYGGDRNDYLDGQAGDDILVAGSGIDIMIAGQGADILFGGDGQDTFVLKYIDDYSEEFYNFSLMHDIVNVTDVLIGYDQERDDINDFVHLNNLGGGAAELLINSDGNPHGFFEQVAVIYTEFEGATVDQLVADGTLIVNDSI